MGYLAIISGITISGVAAWYSIVGLMSIFSGAAIAIAIMGVVLEVGKLITASWLYRNWKTASLLMKMYLIPAIVILMIITSLGIFGFLSRAHIEQNAPVSTIENSIQRLNQQIDAEELNINRNQKILAQLDKSIDVYFEMEYISKGLEERANQAEERQALNSAITESTDRITELELEKLSLQSQIDDIKVEVGPIKYVAELFYENAEAELENTVRILILIIVFVFDPLAVMLLIAGNHTFIQNRKKEVVGFWDTPTGIETTNVPISNAVFTVNTRTSNVESNYIVQTFKDGDKRGEVRIKK